MHTHKATAVVALLLVNQLACADASYQTTTQVTGGTLVDTMKQVSFIGGAMKKMLEPISTRTIVHGNQKAVISKDVTEITDLDKECVIRIDSVKRTYTITTFAEMRQAFANMPKQMEKMQSQVKQAQEKQPPSDLKMTFDVKVNNTGATKVVNGLNAQEQIITLTMHATMTNPPPSASPQAMDASAPASVAYTIVTDAWVAPDPPEIKEIADFDLRMGQKLMQGVDVQAFAEQMKQMQSAGNGAMAQMLGGKPGASEAMAQMAKEINKLKGTRVLEVTSMGGMAPAGAIVPASAPSAPPQTAQSIAGQVASDTATQTVSEEVGNAASKMGIFGNALSNSAISAFHRRKSPPPPPPPPAPTVTTASAGGNETPATQNVVLMATTSQKTDFSAEPVPLSVFEIPAGFKKIESPMVHVSD